MKYKGKPLVTKNTVGITISRPEGNLEFIVSPLSMGWHQRMFNRGIFVYPQPPKVFLKDENGVLIRHPDTKLVQTEENENDPKHVSACAAVTRRGRCLQLVEHLRDDPNVEWDAKPPQSDKAEDWNTYADAILQEVEQIGFTDREILALLDAGERLACISNVDEAINRFLSRASSGEKDEASSKGQAGSENSQPSPSAS